jgi:hypothetical protein
VTLCIAAKTFDSYGKELMEPSVVTCCDHLIETPTAKADIGSKCWMVSPDWEVMMAGTFPLAVELVHIYEQHLKNSTDDGTATIEKLRVPIDIFRKRAAQRFTQSRYAVSREEFMENGRAWFGEQLFREALLDMRSYVEQEEKQVQLLLVGNDGEGFLAIYKYSCGELWECDGFAAIGSGETIAEAALYLRGIVETHPLAYVAYAVYEAKRLGEITPGVGRLTTMSVVDLIGDDEEHLRSRYVSSAGLGFLGGQFCDKYGLRPYEYSPLPKDFLSGSNVLPAVGTTEQEHPQSTTDGPSDPLP